MFEHFLMILQFRYRLREQIAGMSGRTEPEVREFTIALVKARGIHRPYWEGKLYTALASGQMWEELESEWLGGT